MSVELVRRAQKGDAKAFAELARAHLRAAYTVALGVVARPADAEDVAQEAFVVALERIGTCREPDRFRAWLLAIVRTRALNWLDRRRLRDVTRDGEIDGGTIDPPAREPKLAAAIAELPDVQRAVVLLHDLEEMTHAEIAEVLGISEVNSRQHLFQARRALRERLE